VGAVGFIVALPSEAGSLGARPPGFGGLVDLPEGHWLAVSGAGPDYAFEAACRLLERGVAGLVSWGCAAALAPHLKPGHLILPEFVLGAEGSRQVSHADWRSRLARALSPTLPVHTGTLIESVRIIPGCAEKQALYARTEAVATDMESAAVARVAHSRGLPFLAVRAIADSAAMRLPAAVTAALSPRGDIALTKLLGHSLRHPGQFIELARLGRAFGAAMATLRRVRKLSGADCGFTPPFTGASSSLPIHR
jgi:adenosylhomocysteine nucleosidase